ncbi:MAG: hypothetical protein QNJ56_09440 [Gammaproteobacteria bacterium]|nr:hypothetical protein [Gammaproteobacteria bacterium]
MRYREGEIVDPNQPYTENTLKIMELSYWMSIPLGIILLWLAIKGRLMWLKVWSVGLIILGLAMLSYHFFYNS